LVLQELLTLLDALGPAFAALQGSPDTAAQLPRLMVVDAFSAVMSPVMGRPGQLSGEGSRAAAATQERSHNCQSHTWSARSASSAAAAPAQQLCRACDHQALKRLRRCVTQGTR